MKKVLIIISILLAYFLPIRYINFLDNERIIGFVKNKYKKDKKIYLQLIKCTEDLKIDNKYFLIHYFPRMDISGLKDLNKKNYIEINKEKEIIINNIIKKIRCRVFIKKHEYIAFEYKKSNFTGSSYIKLVYDLRNARPTKKQYPDFEILEKEQRPSSFSKWIYIIDDYWYILIE